MSVQGFCDVESVSIVTTGSVVSIRVYENGGNGSYTELNVQASTSHLECIGLNVDQQFHAKE